MPLSKRKKTILKIFGATAFVVVALFIWSALIEPNRLVVNEQQIKLPNFPKRLDGFKIVAIADIHGGSNAVDEEKIHYLVTLANQQQPDLIVLLGDFVSQQYFNRAKLKMDSDVVAKNINGLKAKYGVYAALGNHDWWNNGAKIRKELEENGMKVIENDVSPIEVNGQTIWILGIPDFLTRQPIVLQMAMSGINKPGPIIAITHNPDVFAELPSNITLTLAGHTHGGQVNIPFIGSPIVPSNYGQRYAAGHIVENGRHLFVTTGVGTSVLPFRFRVPPEIAVLTLSSAQ
jgi:predicted MPP superfamily phosphohydrolase